VTCAALARRACAKQCDKWCLEELRLRGAPTVRTASKWVNVAAIHRIARHQRDVGHPQSRGDAQSCASGVFRASFGGSPAGYSSWLDRPEHPLGVPAQSLPRQNGPSAHSQDLASASRLLVRGCEDACFMPAFDWVWAAVGTIMAFFHCKLCGCSCDLAPPPHQLIPGFGIARLVGLARFLRMSLSSKRPIAATNETS
jgi:hypothetical protein